MTNTRFLTVLALLLPIAAHAHPGHSVHEIGGIGWGMLHPFTGIDHLLVALSVGLLAAFIGRSSLALYYLSAGAIGAVAGMQFGVFGGLETGLAISVLIMGVSLMVARKLSERAAIGIVALVAALHGWTHGAEAGAGSSAALAGIFFATATIVALGAVCGWLCRRAPRLVPQLGAGVAMAALVLLAITL